MNEMSPTEKSTFVLRDGIEVRFKETNKILFVRYKIERTATEVKFLSRDDYFGVVSWHGGMVVGVVHKTEFRKINVQALKIKKLDPPKIIDDCAFIYRVTVYEGDGEPTEPVQDFYFAEINPASKTEKEINDWLLKSVRDFYEYEVRESQQKSAEIEKKKFEAAPARLPFEEKQIDHYKNWQEVGTRLLRKEWVSFFNANDKLLAAKTDAEKAQLRIEVWKAYIVDHKALFGTLPNLSETDKAELLADDKFIVSLNSAIKRPKSPVGNITKQLFNSWLIKNYYRMNDAALQKAFNKDWSYRDGQHKGNTLAKHARSIGLLFALKRGRPENPNSLPSG